MWYLDGDRPARGNNRFRAEGRAPILRVTARVAGSRERTHRIAAIVILVAALAGLGVAAALGFRELGAWLFSRNPRFAIRAGGLDLQSSGRLQFAHLRDYARLAEGTNLFALSLGDVRKSLLAVPVIKSAQVDRVLPDTLRVRVAERSAVARLSAGNGFQFTVDDEGMVLGPSSRSSSLPLLVGVNEPGLSPGTQILAVRFHDALEAVEHCAAAGLGRYFQLRQLSVEPEEYLDVQLGNGTRVLLGRENLRWRLDRLAEILQDATQKRKAVVSVDLTVDSNFPVVYSQR